MNCDALQGIAFENPLLERMANAQESPGLDSEPGLFICAQNTAPYPPQGPVWWI